jgi:hypothetical protein
MSSPVLVKERFQTTRSQTGLVHYQVRRYDAWQRYLTLAMLAHAYLSDAHYDEALLARMRIRESATSFPRPSRRGRQLVAHTPDQSLGVRSRPSVSRHAAGRTHAEISIRRLTIIASWQHQHLPATPASPGFWCPGHGSGWQRR